MISTQELLDRIQKNVGVPWQSQRGDGYSDGVLEGDPQTSITGIAAEYVRDAVAAGEKKALIQLPHEGGEEEGMRNCAEWMKTFVSEVPVQFIPSGDRFWIPA